MGRASFRYANIGIAVAAVIMAAGVITLRGAGEGALQAVGIGAFLAAMAVYLLLCERDDRRRRRNQ
jgi:hypothetical protein